jgi:uncharacterized membrane protein
MDVKTQRTLLAASVAGLLAAAGTAWLGGPQSAQAEEGKEKCYGVNKCQGTGDCGGKAHSCAGQNSCEAQGWLSLPEGVCTKIIDGRLTPEDDS